MGVKIIVTAAFDIKAENIKEKPYKMVNMTIGLTIPASLNKEPKIIIKLPKSLSNSVFWMAMPKGIKEAIRKITDQLIDSYASWIDMERNTNNIISRGHYVET